MNKKLWLMPKYYKDFKCKANKCRHTCCSSWKIPVSQDEYFRLIGMECSKDLHDKIDVCFEDVKSPSEQKYKYISYNWLGNCPLNKDGLCMLHAEQGEDNLPMICRLYPRSLKRIGDYYIACCSSACEKVVEMLYEQKDLDLIKTSLDAEPTIEYEIDENQKNSLLETNAILRDNDTPLQERIKSICLLTNEEEFLQGYNTDLNPVEEIIKLLDRFKESDDFLSEVFEIIKERYVDNYDRYYEDVKEFEATFTNWSDFFENVLNNSIIYENYPFVDDRFDDTKAYKGLCASYGLLRLITIAYTSIHCDKDSLIDATAGLFRLIDHTAFYYNVHVICDNPAIFLKI